MKVGDTFKNVVAHIDLRHTADAHNKELLESLHVRTRVFNEKLGLPEHKAVAFEIPKGFRTDGASVPSLFWSFIHPLAWWILFPSIVHDRLWRDRFITAYIVDIEQEKIVQKIGVFNVNYKYGNQIMLEKMQSFFGGVVGRYAVYYILELVRIVTKGK